MQLLMYFEDWGTIEYAKAWEQQNNLFNKLLLLQREGKEITAENQKILFCEHPHVYTLGKNGKQNNLLISEEYLKQINASYFRTDRGGDITYHGPGQIVAYPILSLQSLHFSLKSYIAYLEEVVIKTLQEFGIHSERLEGATGVWIDINTSNARKICAIGVRASSYITMHGFALNVNTNLSYYNHINPCGFVDKGVTSMQQELGKTISMEDVKQKLQKHFLSETENHIKV